MSEGSRRPRRPRRRRPARPPAPRGRPGPPELVADLVGDALKLTEAGEVEVEHTADIVRELVLALGGTITLGSEHGAGSSSTVRQPDLAAA
jgi:hypothetical protein